MTDLQSRYTRLDQLMSEHGLDAMLITSRDCQLAEYTPIENNPRYQLCGFTGSMGDAIYLSPQLASKIGQSAQCLLFVDGRYHLQADRETDSARVSVRKLQYGEGVWLSIQGWLKDNSNNIKKLGLDGYRFSSADVKELAALGEQHDFALHSFNHYEVDEAIQLPSISTKKPIYQLADHQLGRSIKDNIVSLQNSFADGVEAETTVYLTVKSDDVAYLLNSRGYHSAYQSAHFGFLLLVDKTLILYLPKEASECEVRIDHLADFSLIVIRNDLDELKKRLAEKTVTALCYHSRDINYVLQQLIDEVCADAECVDQFSGVTPIRVVKSQAELKAMKVAFLKSSIGVAQTIRWAKYGDEVDRVYTEGCLAAKLWQTYEAQGALGLSFNTIAGAAENSALIHYSDIYSTRPLVDGDLILLDSGAYYDEGLATDITRGCLCNHSRTAQAQPWQKDIYTTTLKASIAGLTAEFHESTKGADLDKVIRSIIQEQGYEYAHGTGHGVGIDVHEAGIGISPKVTTTFTENAVVTIEPGIYLEGKGGVRVENVVIVKRSEFKPDHLHFEMLSYVGYDWDLIDLSMLSEDDKDYLKAYEHKCQELGTEITRCPLLVA